MTVTTWRPPDTDGRVSEIRGEHSPPCVSRVYRGKVTVEAPTAASAVPQVWGAGSHPILRGVGPWAE